MANHANEPNLERIEEGDRLFLKALRPIAAGEELTFRYNPEARKRLGVPD